MNKSKNVLFIIILLICLLSSVLILFSVSKDDDEMEIVVNYDDILFDINTELGNKFIHDEEISKYLPINLRDDSNYFFAINNITQDEYYIIVKNIQEDELETLEFFVDSYNERNEKKLQINKNEIYTYLIKSNENYGLIDGIIRSYIYEEKSN